MNNTTKAVLGGVGAMLLSFVFILTVSATNRGPGSDMSTGDILNKLAEAANGMKGEEVGPHVIVDHATVENGRLLTYTYEVNNISGTYYDRRRKQKAEKLIRKEACRDRATRKAIDGGAHLRYAYNNRKGTQLFTINVNSLSCSRIG